jgi:hypothetical protein
MWELVGAAAGLLILFLLTMLPGRIEFFDVQQDDRSRFITRLTTSGALIFGFRVKPFFGGLRVSVDIPRTDFLVLAGGKNFRVHEHFEVDVVRPTEIYISAETVNSPFVVITLGKLLPKRIKVWVVQPEGG